MNPPTMKPSPMSWARRRPRQRGVAIVEMTIVIAFLLVPAIVVMVEAVRLFQAYRTLVQQVNVAARYLSVQAPGQGHDQARCIFRTGHTPEDCATRPPLLGGLDAAGFSLSIEDASSAGSAFLDSYSASGNLRLNTVSVTAAGYRHAFVLVTHLGLDSVEIPAVSAIYRQVG